MIDDPVLADPSPATQELCEGSTTVECLVGSASGGVGNYIYSWRELSDPDVELPNGDQPTYCPPTNVVGEFNYFYVVTTDAPGADCETTSGTAQVIVQPAPVISLQPIA